MKKQNVPSDNKLPRDLITDIPIGQDSIFFRDTKGAYFPVDFGNPFPVVSDTSLARAMLCTLQEIKVQLKLMNMRNEEVLGTKITERDVT